MDANNTPILKTPSTLRFITTSFLIVEIENSLREWRQSIRGDDPCQGKTSEPDGRAPNASMRTSAPVKAEKGYNQESASNSSVVLDTVSGARTSRLLERTS